MAVQSDPSQGILRATMRHVCKLRKSAKSVSESSNSSLGNKADHNLANWFSQRIGGFGQPDHPSILPLLRDVRRIGIPPTLQERIQHPSQSPNHLCRYIGMRNSLQSRDVFFCASAFRPVWPGSCIVLSLNLCTTSNLRPGPGGSRTAASC